FVGAPVSSGSSSPMHAAGGRPSGTQLGAPEWASSSARVATLPSIAPQTASVPHPPSRVRRASPSARAIAALLPAFAMAGIIAGVAALRPSAASRAAADCASEEVAADARATACKSACETDLQGATCVAHGDLLRRGGKADDAEAA